MGGSKNWSTFAPNMEAKHLYIISGPNGAGKTTASYSVLPKILQCKEFVNADEIARGLSPFNPESVAIEAGRLMLSRIADLLRKNESFSIETTLSTRSYFRLVEKAHQQGYEVTLLFFWLKLDCYFFLNYIFSGNLLMKSWLKILKMMLCISLKY